jgi:hypothetical protein
VTNDQASVLADVLRQASTLPGAVGVEVLGPRGGTVYIRQGRVTGIELSDESHECGTSGDKSADVRNVIDGPVSLCSTTLDTAQTLFEAQVVIEPRKPSSPALRIHPGLEAPRPIDHALSVELLVASVRERRVAVAADIDPDRPLVLLPITQPSVVIDLRQWSLVSRIDGRLTPRDLAAVTGVDLTDLLADVDRLAARGLCASVTPEAWLGTHPLPVEQLPVEHSPVIVHQRAPETPPAGVTTVRFNGPPEWAEAMGTDTSTDAASDPELIQRLISGLRELG